MEKKFLNEEKYQKTEKTITIVAIVILIIGLGIGGYLIYGGVAKPNASKVDTLQKELEKQRQALVDKGVTFSPLTEYTDGEAYDLKIITNALDPSFNHCNFDEYKNNSLTKEYCAAKNSVGTFASTSKIMYGVFICAATCMISFSVLAFAKHRKVIAYAAQSVIPIAKEGIDEMAPTMGNAAKEVAKGIKEGLKDDKK